MERHEIKLMIAYATQALREHKTGTKERAEVQALLIKLVKQL